VISNKASQQVFYGLNENKTPQVVTPRLQPMCSSNTACALLGSTVAEAAVVPQSTLTPADSVYMGGLAYNDSSSGQYVFTGSIYQGAPVYENANDSTWKLYR